MSTWKNKNPMYLLVGMQNGAAAVENGRWFFRKLNVKLPCGPVIPLLCMHSKESKAGAVEIFMHSYS